MTADGGMALGTVATALGFAALGTAFGAAYFAALRANARLYLAGSGWAWPLALHAVRITGAVLVFAMAAQHGALSLLAALAGFLIARLVMVRPERLRS